jgi:hypothetical protein
VRGKGGGEERESGEGGIKDGKSERKRSKDLKDEQHHLH